MAQVAGAQPRRSVRPGSPAARLVRLLVLLTATFAVTASGTLGYLSWRGRAHEGGLGARIRQGAVDTFLPASLLFEGSDRVNVLLIGEDLPIDERQRVLNEFSRSDTMIVLSLEQSTSRVSAVSLPRDMKVTIPGHGGGHKLNAAFRIDGPPTLIATIRANLGIRIDHYVKTNFHGFIELIDQIGGLDVDVERDMNYDDEWQDLHVHLKKGLQHLDGKQVEEYVRWRKNNPRSKGGDGISDPLGDLGREERQQKMMKVLAAKILQPQYLLKFRGIMDTLRKHVTTDLSDRQLLALGGYLKGVNHDQLQTATVPVDYKVENGAGFMFVLKQQAVPLLQQLLGTTFDPRPLMQMPNLKGGDTKGPGKSRADEPAAERGKTRQHHVELETPYQDDPSEEVPHSRAGNHGAKSGTDHGDKPDTGDKGGKTPPAGHGDQGAKGNETTHTGGEGTKGNGDKPKPEPKPTPKPAPADAPH